MKKGYIFLDVESVGINGEPFAFAYEVVDKATREVVDKGFYHYPTRLALGKKDDRSWVNKNCVPTFDDPKYKDIKEEVPFIHQLCDKFREVWKTYHKDYGIIVADCPFPVESNFLSLCLLEPSPIPIYDIATMLMMKGRNPIKDYKRLESELPKHNPYCDIQQTKRMFFNLIDDQIDFLD
jgi:hypothetical protein